MDRGPGPKVKAIKAIFSPSTSNWATSPSWPECLTRSWSRASFRGGQAGRAEIQGVIIGERYHLEPGLLEIGGQAGGAAEDKDIAVVHVLGGFAAVAQRPLQVAEADIRPAQDLLYRLK